ncbi:MAG TPA: 3'-5' exonuclease [Gemmatimonadaceae bacterium]|nr:3'-5' exonuclease [Gemmatimonadaceae bacterium]
MNRDRAATEAAAALLDADADYIVLRRLPRASHYATAPRDDLRRALFVDVETTGLEAKHDVVIQFCGVPFDYSLSSGDIHALHPAITCYEDPGRPIPAIVVEKTGITDAMVAGKRLDDAAINAAAAEAVLIIAHNAAFDRGFLDRRLPIFAEKHWACSQVDVPWASRGYDSSKLEFLLYKHARTFYEAHRADEDVYAGIHLLATPFSDGMPPMRLLLENARRPMWRVFATGAPFDSKDLLKARGYRWNPQRQVWWREVPDAEREDEVRWLREAAYQRPDANPPVEKIDPRRRFANDRA